LEGLKKRVALFIYEFDGVGRSRLLGRRAVGEIGGDAGFAPVYEEVERESCGLLYRSAVRKSHGWKLLIPVSLVLTNQFG